MSEFRIRPAGLRPGSIMKDGTIVTAAFGGGTIGTCSFGKVTLHKPVSRRRWRAYLAHGWIPAADTIIFVDEDSIQGTLERPRQ